MLGRSFLNCVKDEVNEKALQSNAYKVLLKGLHSADCSEMKDILRWLSDCEALEVNELSYGSFKYAHSSLVSLLCLIINACNRQQYITKQVIAVHVVPLLISKIKDPASYGNYRLIAIASASS